MQGLLDASLGMTAARYQFRLHEAQFRQHLTHIALQLVNIWDQRGPDFFTETRLAESPDVAGELVRRLRALLESNDSPSVDIDAIHAVLLQLNLRELEGCRYLFEEEAGDDAGDAGAPSSSRG